MDTIVCADERIAIDFVCDTICIEIKKKKNLVLGLATGRTMIPLRAFAEATGGIVSYYSDNDIRVWI